MRQGCTYIAGLKTHNPEFRNSLVKSERPFDDIVSKLEECATRYNGCERCPDLKMCERRFNGICSDAQQVSPPFADMGYFG